MRNHIKLLLLRRALEIVAGKPAPSSIPRTGDKAKNVNCFTAEIRSLTGKYFDISVDAVKKEGVEGRLWNDDRYEFSCSLPNAWIGDVEFSATHFLGPHDFRYKSPLEMIVWEFLRFPKLLILKEKVVQLWFNSKTPKRTDRIELIKKLIEFRIEEESDENQIYIDYRGLTQISILIKIYGGRICGHPNFTELNAMYKILIESLVDSGDVKENEGQYKATGRALTSIAQYEEENRRHREQMQHNNWIKILTVVLVFVGLVQAFVIWVK